MSNIRATIRQEREALGFDLEAIDEAAWTTPSLCPKWTVRDVLAHMTVTTLTGISPELLTEVPHL